MNKIRVIVMLLFTAMLFSFANVSPVAAAGPIVQFDANALALQNGDTVTVWGGQTAFGSPTFLTNQTPNGMPAVQFNGGGDRMGDNVTVPASAAGDWILVAVIKPQNIGAYHNLADDDPASRPMLWIDPNFNYELNISGGTGAKAAGAGTDGWDIVIADSRFNQLYVNSPIPNATGGSAISYSATKNYDFFHRDGGQTFNGLVAEMRIYTDSAEFGGNFAALHSEMVAKYFDDGVPVTLQEGTATYSQELYCCGLNVDQTVDGYIGTPANGVLNGWAIYDEVGQNQTAVWETASDVNASQLDFKMYQYWGGAHNLGRFRLSYTTDDRSTFADGLNSGGDVIANWTILTGATISGTGGETFTVLGDNSILVSVNNPDTTVYSVSFSGSFSGITGIRLEALSDASLPFSGPGRQANGNFTLTELTLDATSTPSGPDVCPAGSTGTPFTNGPTFGTICDDGGRVISMDNATLNGEPAVRFDVPAGSGQVVISACDASKDAILYTIAENQAAAFTVQCGSSNMEMISGEMLMELYFSSNLLASGTALSGTALNYETLNLEQQFNLASGAMELQLLNLDGGNLALAELSAGNGLLLEQATGEMSALSTNTSLLELQLLTALGGNLALAKLSAGNGLLLDQATGEMSALSTNTSLLELQLLNLAGTNLAVANLEAGSGLLYDQQAGQLEALASAVQLQFLSAAQQTLINASLGSGSTVSFDQALGALEVLQGAIDAGWLDETGAEIASGLIQAGQEVIFNQLLSEFQVSSLGGLVEMVFQGSSSFSVLAGELDLTLLDVVGAVVGRLSMDSGDTALWDAVQSLLTVDAGFMNVLLLDESGVFAQTLLDSGDSFNLSAAKSPLDILNAMLGLSFMNLTGPALGPQVATGSDHVNPPGTSVPLSAVGHLDVRDPGNIHPDGLNPDFFQNHITDVWAWGNYAYLGSFDRPFCSRKTTGVHIIDISDPAAPAYAGFLPSPDSTRPNDVKVFHVETPFFAGEILVHTNEKCTLGWTAAEDLSTVQAIDPPLSAPALGVGIYDVTDPSNPVKLDDSFLDFQTHNTYLWQHGENAYMAVVSDDNNRGLHIVDMTDPANPSEIAVIDQTVYPQQLVGQVGLLGHSPTPHEDGHAGADVLLHDVWVQENDGQVIAYLSYWDVGMVLFDVTDPANPVFLGDSEYILPDPVTGGEAPAGNSHVAVPSEDGIICIGGDEDFFGEAGWGYGRVYDCTDPANIEEIGQMHTNNVQTPPPGNFTAHNVMVAEDLASWAWYFDGIPVFDFSSCRDANGAPVAACTPVEVGRFVDPNGSDFWGVYLHEINGVTYLLGSDRDTGLWIIPAVDRPNAIADTFNTGDGAPLTVEAPGVLYNDVDNDSASLAAELVAQASSGVVDLNNDGSFTYAPNGSYCVSDSFTYRASDGALDSNVATVTINCLPTADAGGPYSGDEGAAIPLSGASASDADGDALTYSWTVDSALCSFNNANALQPNLTCSDNGSVTVTLAVSDGTESVSSDAAVTVANVAPDLGNITIIVNETPEAAPVIPLGTVIYASAVFTDPGTVDTHTAVWNWDSNGTSDTSAGTVTQGAGSGSVADSHTYGSPGVYMVDLTVTDDDGGVVTSSFEFVVVYDPSGGFVIGGGWIDSPVNADYEYMQVGGKANFGFVSKYKKGATTPTGQTQFQFKAGDLNFHSSSYDWLVIAGANAKYKGVGTINGSGNYGFMLTATDSDINGGGTVDSFRIKIWDTMDTEDEADDVLVYDNQILEGDDSYVGTEIGGGNIKIHKG